ncbi:MAG TPA: glucose-6-phosphate isomerase [Burkholderiales bacterium]|jgi:glucose-6-phosphate isomerase|nr:glucose-6-phosphate isomerase [Burkholderiales bacterium]
MARLTERSSWKALHAHAQRMRHVSILDLFERDPRRAQDFSLEACGLFLDYSKNPLTRETLSLLIAAAGDASLPQQIQAMFEGRRINTTEKRAVLHVALRNRSNRPILLDGRDVMPEVNAVLARMQQFSESVREGRVGGFTGRPFTDVVNIGIGGSDLGPLTVTRALNPFASRKLRVHFVSNVDAAHLGATVAGLDAETTLFIVSSKTFTTQETLANARSARDWLLARLARASPANAVIAAHFAAVSTNLEATSQFGIAPERVFGFWDWVGGRYSLWSAIGLPIALAVGFERFEQLLEGAHAMDEHFRTAPLERNMPALLGLIGVWHGNFLGAPTHAVLPYAQDLAGLPMHLQQLDMESNGKRVDRAGEAVDYATGPVIWGAPGTNGQHAFFQHLHQSPQVTPCDFIVAARSEWQLPEHHELLLANCLAQTEALLRGKTTEEALAEVRAQGLEGEEAARLAAHRTFPGNRPSNTIVLPRIDPRSVGALVALYEHKVFVQGALWNINSFDQWGVELGKQLAAGVLRDLRAGSASAAHDPSTRALIDRIIAMRRTG